jgi:ribosome-associated toxin RatA of RatAB toxin-antitoxin module
VHELKAELGVGFMGWEERYTSRVTCTKWSLVKVSRDKYLPFPLFQLKTPKRPKRRIRRS